MTPTDSFFWPYITTIFEDQADNGVAYLKMSDGNGVDRMLEDGRSEDIYPAVFFLRPKMTLSMVDNHLALSNFNTVMYVFCHAKLDDRDTQDEAYRLAESIATRFIQRLQTDERSCINFMDFNSIQLEPIIYNGSDSAYGYEVRFKLGLPSNEIFC